MLEGIKSRIYFCSEKEGESREGMGQERGRRKEEVRKEREEWRPGETRAIRNCREVTKGLLRRGRDIKQSKDMCLLDRTSQVSRMTLHHASQKQDETIHNDSWCEFSRSWLWQWEYKPLETCRNLGAGFLQNRNGTSSPSGLTSWSDIYISFIATAEKTGIQ